jgi:hypothetical protein
MNSSMKEGRAQSLAGVLRSRSFLAKVLGMEEGHSVRTGSEAMVSVCVRELLRLGMIYFILTSNASLRCSWWAMVDRSSCSYRSVDVVSLLGSDSLLKVAKSICICWFGLRWTGSRSRKSCCSYRVCLFILLSTFPRYLRQTKIIRSLR